MSDALITFADINEHAVSIVDAIMYSIPQVWEEVLWNVILEFEARDSLPKLLHWTLRTFVFCLMALVSLSLINVIQLLIAGNLLPSMVEKWPTSGIPINAACVGIAITILIWRWEDRNHELEKQSAEELELEGEDGVDDLLAMVDDFCEDDFGRIWIVLWVICIIGTFVDAMFPFEVCRNFISWAEIVLGVIVLWDYSPKPQFLKSFMERFRSTYSILCREHNGNEEDDDEDDEDWETEEEIGHSEDQEVGD